VNFFSLIFSSSIASVLTGEETVFLIHEIHENPDKHDNVKHCTNRHQIKFHFPGLMPEHRHRSTGSKGSDKG